MADLPQEQAIPVMHLRQAFGGGGGADTVLMDQMCLGDGMRFPAFAAYLHRHGDDISPIVARLKSNGLDHAAIPGRRLLDISQLRRLARLARERGTRILHCHDPKTHVYGPILRLMVPGLRLAATMHGWIENRPRSALYNRLDMMALKRFGLVVAVSGPIREQAEAAGVRVDVVLENGVDTNFWSTPGRSARTTGRTFRIGFAGRMSPEKGPDVFVRAAALALDKNPRMDFVMAGEGPELEAAKALARELGIAGAVEFPGFVDRDGLRELFAGLDALAMTSHTEGVPLTLLEASSMELAVVSTEVGGVGGVVDHGRTGLLAADGDAPALAGHFLRLAAEPDTALNMGRTARQKMLDKFSLSRVVERLEGLYLDLCQDRDMARGRAKRGRP